MLSTQPPRPDPTHLRDDRRLVAKALPGHPGGTLPLSAAPRWAIDGDGVASALKAGGVQLATGGTACSTGEGAIQHLPAQSGGQFPG